MTMFLTVTFLVYMAMAKSKITDGQTEQFVSPFGQKNENHLFWLAEWWVKNR